MSAKLRVALVGATGETGQIIASTLLSAPEQFEVTALVRPSSMNKKETISLKENGANIITMDLGSPVEDIAKTLQGIDVVVCTIFPSMIDEQKALVSAAKIAGVGRFVPSWFGPTMPPRGVIDMRDMKEDVLDHVKRLYLPYTVIDVGWWFQLVLPRLPSGKTDKFTPIPGKINSDGNVPMALTDCTDIGRYVARIITDPRTVNKMVFAYGEVLTQNQAWDLLEKESGEKLPREATSGEELLATAVKARMALAENPQDPTAFFELIGSQYRYSWGVRGDNTPEHARYLGYLDAKELYPDFKPAGFHDFVKSLVAGTAIAVYDGRFS